MTSPPTKAKPHEVLLSRPPLAERGWLIEALRDETVGGALLLVAAAVALVWANSPWADSYESLVSTEVGPSALHLNLPLSVWAADGLLAVFFFIAGLELKHELVLGSLSRPSRAAVPVAAALGGMVLPALLFVAVNLTMEGGSPEGWGIPMATDIAFALAVLAVVGRFLPVALRAFLLTLAVVDDLGAILVIAVFYSKGFSPGWLLAALGGMAIYWLLQRRRITSPLLYVPLVLAVWYFTHESGVHATVAGVALGLLTRVHKDPGEAKSPADRMEHLIHPVSAGICVPLFAFFSAGVNLRSTGVIEALSTPVAIGIIVGLVVGKPVGVFVAAWVTARFTRASLTSSISWRDVFAVGLIAGIGFTVSLLIAELAYTVTPDVLNSSKAAILAASVASAVLAAIALASRSRHYRQVYEAEEADSDADGVPDVYQDEERPTPSTG
jgi:NhaA family Na+:H+ antiporter